MKNVRRLIHFFSHKDVKAIVWLTTLLFVVFAFAIDIQRHGVVSASKVLAVAAFFLLFFSWVGSMAKAAAKPPTPKQDELEKLRDRLRDQSNWMY